MDRKRTIIGLLGLGALLPQILGCIVGPGCLPNDTTVNLRAERSVGVGTLRTRLTAEAYGSNTCGDTPANTTIVEYQWDLDGDGLYEETGAYLESIDVAFDEPGRYEINVAVVDSDGVVAATSTTLEVLTVLEPQDALDRLRVWMGNDDYSAECRGRREVCVRVSSELDFALDAYIEVQHNDGLLIEEQFMDVDVGSDVSNSLCMTLAMDAGDATVVLVSGDASRTLDLSVRSGSQPADCAR